MTLVAPVTARRLQARLATAQSTGRLPSVVAGVVRDGDLVWSGWYGDVAPGEPEDVQYRIGSITKTLTAVLVLQLVRDGRVSLEAPVAEYLGEVGYADRTVRSLLAHNAGIQSEPVGSWWERSAGLSFDQLSSGNDGTGTVFPALQQFHYSNLGYALLGEVVARAYGQTWWECVQTRILNPLGMARTSYLPEGNAARGFSVHPYAGTLTPEPDTDTGAMAPAGQAWSTVADLATYARFLLEGHREVLSGEDMLAAAHHQAGSRDDGLTSAYGLGFQLRAGGSGMLVGHTGSMPGFLAACLVDRPRNTGAVLLCNGTSGVSPGEVAAGLLEELESSEPTVPGPWRPVDGVPPALADALGVWHWGNTPFVFAMEGEELVVRHDGEETYRFGLDGERVVGRSGYHAGEELRMVRNLDGSVNHLDIATFIYTRTPYDKDAPIPGGHPDRA